MRTMHKEEFHTSYKSASSIETFLEEKPWCACLVLSQLQHICKGHLTLILPDQSQFEFIGTEEQNHKVTLKIKYWRTFRRIILRGEVGFGEAYIKGEWEASDLTKLFVFFIKNQNELQEGPEPIFLLNWFYKIRSWFLRNTPKQNLSNIHTHYDLGNNFYKLWLDPSMTYSCALFDGKKRTLEKAQQAKYNRILDHLNPQKGERILDIGCGWGGFAEVASHKGYHVEGITLSSEQLAYAHERAKKFPTEAHFALKDYREISDQYDYVVSIGMLEHVGKNYWQEYFQKIFQLLKPGGRAMIQSIVYAGADYHHYVKGMDFIRLYIFPGGFLPTPQAVIENAKQAGFKVKDEFEFGLDYAKTLSCWRHNFLQALPEVYKIGFNDRFKRMWLYYLSASEAAFLTHKTSVMQFELEKAK